jgi:hypothetical protein
MTQFPPDAGERRDPLSQARALQAMGRLDEAIAIYRQVLERMPESVMAWNNLAMAYKARGQLEEAARALNRAAKLSPAAAEIHYNLGNLLHAMGRPAQAVSAFRRAITIRPNYATAHWNLSLALLLDGQLAAGFEEYEWRWRNPEFPTEPRVFAQPAWDGSSRAGTILLYAEQGAGDVIQFARYARHVAARGPRVVMEVHAPLVPLIERVAGVAAVVPVGGAPPAFDAQAPIVSLPRLFGTTLETIPAEIPYVAPRAELVARWRARLGEAGPRIGLVWAGAPGHANDRNRSMPLATLAPLRETGARLFSLQKDKREGDDLAGIEDLGPELADFEQTAAALAGLDLVVCVDTSVAHLAGAMGVPAWIMLPAIPDWRWLMGRGDSPWYPSLTLFRQSKAGDWSDVVARIAAAIPSRDWRRPRS